MKTRQIGTFLAVALLALLVAVGCQKKAASEKPEAKQPATETQIATQAETTQVAQPDTTAPEPPPGYKSIHQLQLEEHKKQEEKKQP